METKYFDLREKIDDEKIKEAAEAIKEGKLVLFPTETVYGLGANGLDENAVKKIYAAKGRASDNPLILHIADIKILDKLVKSVGDIESKLIEKFWPGPLTIIFEKKEIVALAPADLPLAGADLLALLAHRGGQPCGKSEPALLCPEGLPVDDPYPPAEAGPFRGIRRPRLAADGCPLPGEKLPPAQAPGRRSVPRPV